MDSWYWDSFLLSNHSLPWLIHHITSTLAWTQTTREIRLQTAEWKSHDTETGRCDICTRAKKVCMYTTYSLWRKANAPKGSFMFSVLRWQFDLHQLVWYQRFPFIFDPLKRELPFSQFSQSTELARQRERDSTKVRAVQIPKYGQIRRESKLRAPSRRHLTFPFLNKLADLCRQLI